MSSFFRTGPPAPSFFRDQPKMFRPWKSARHKSRGQGLVDPHPVFGPTRGQKMSPPFYVSRNIFQADLSSGRTALHGRARLPLSREMAIERTRRFHHHDTSPRLQGRWPNGRGSGGRVPPFGTIPMHKGFSVFRRSPFFVKSARLAKNSLAGPGLVPVLPKIIWQRPTGRCRI